MSTALVVSETNTFPKQTHSMVRERRERQARLHNAVTDAFTTLSMLRALQKSQGELLTQSSEACVEQLKKTETELFSEVPQGAVRGKSVEADGKQKSPAKATTTAVAVVKSTNPDYIDKLKHRPKSAPTFTVQLTPLPLSWDQRRTKSKMDSSAQSTLSGWFSKPGSGPVPNIKVAESENPRLMVEKQMQERVKGIIPPKKGPKFEDPVAAKFSKQATEPVKKVAKDFVPACAAVDPTTLHSYSPKKSIKREKGMKFK